MTHLVAWLGTYAIHSTVLLGLALFVTRVIQRDAVWDLVWKAALLGGLFTATLTLLPTRYASSVSLPTATRFSIAAPDPVEMAPTVDDAVTPPLVRDVQRARRVPIRVLLVVLWGVGAFALLARLVIHNLGLYSKLRGRVMLSDGPLPSMLAEIRRRAGFWKPVRLSVSSACATPIALGSREICLPQRFSTDLDEAQQRAAMAHEVAHLIRRDPVWQFVAGVIESVLFFQPMNRLARIRMRDAAEHMSDDWAAVACGAPLDLARCLGNIASWLGEPVPAGTLAMAEGGSPLVERVKRLAEWRGPARRASWLHALAAAAMVLGIGFVSPSITATAAIQPSRVAVVRAPILPDSVVRFKGSGVPLPQRWSWAQSQNRNGSYWVGWSFDAATTTGIESTPEGLVSEDDHANTVARILAPEPLANQAVIILGFDGRSSSPSTVRIRAAGDRLNLRGEPLYWLGFASGDESLLHLQSLYPLLKENIRTEIAAAYTLHKDFEPMIAATHDLLRNESSAGVRAEAVQWLPRTHPQERRVTGLLADVVARDASESVQGEAVDAIADLARKEVPGAREALIRIANEHKSWKLRSEAAQVLAAMSN